MKLTAMILAVLVLFCSSVLISTAQQEDTKQIAYYHLVSDKCQNMNAEEYGKLIDQDLIPFGWIQGKAIVSKTELSSEEAQAHCSGKQAKSGVKVLPMTASYEIDGGYKYFYVMQRVLDTYKPNLKFELKMYRLEEAKYTFEIRDESGEG